MNGIRPDTARAVVLAPRMHLLAIHTATVDARVTNVSDMKAPFEWAPLPIEVAWSSEQNEFRAIVSFGVSIGQRRGDALGQTHLIRVVFRIDYGSPGARDLPEEEVMHYLGVHAVMHGWPYFRADVLSFTSRFEIPPLTLPVLLSSNVAQLAFVRRLNEDETRPPQPSTAPALPGSPDSMPAVTAPSKSPRSKPAARKRKRGTK